MCPARPHGGEAFATNRAPAGEPASGAEAWEVGLHVWVERAGRSVLGPGRLELLEGIDRGQSISAAARVLGMSYRRAWELVRSINEAAGEPLVTAATGGARGGGARLTPLGRSAVRVFREAQAKLRQAASGLLPRLRQAAGEPALHVVAAVSLEEVVGRLLTDFAAQAPGARVRAVYGASDELADQLLAGAPGDVFLTADPRQIERLRAAGLLRRGDPVALAGNGLAAIAAEPLIVRRAADLARGGWRVALAEPACPLGGYTRAYLEPLRLYAALRRRAVWVENSRAAVTAVRAGQADVALVYASDAARAGGCRTLFRATRLPVPVRYCAAALRGAGRTADARRLLAFLSSPRSARCFRRCGFLVPRRG